MDCHATSQMVNVAKYALSSKVFSPLFTHSRKLLPGSFLFFAEYASFRDDVMLFSNMINHPVYKGGDQVTRT